jgi:hypothetical protein
MNNRILQSFSFGCTRVNVSLVNGAIVTTTQDTSTGKQTEVRTTAIAPGARTNEGINEREILAAARIGLPR